MNTEQRSLALRLAYEHVRIMAAQAKSPAADELTREALNCDEREVFIAVVESYLEGDKQHFEHDLALSLFKLF